MNKKISASREQLLPGGILCLCENLHDREESCASKVIQENF